MIHLANAEECERFSLFLGLHYQLDSMYLDLKANLYRKEIKSQRKSCNYGQDEVQLNVAQVIMLFYFLHFTLEL